MPAQPERAAITWSTPECPFTVECSSRVLDDIRLAANDAFFSLPRGGAEIGGILLGEWQEGLLTISGFAALECEHALGPSFTLSLSDENRLQELLRAASAAGAGRVVGWYHSHTRTSVSLSDSDLTIHNRFFPEPWQVALVVKPHTMEPMRGGFFFRGPGGIIHTGASYREFPIEPLPMQQVPRAAPMEPQPPPLRAAASGPIVDVRAAVETRPAAAATVVEVRAEPEPPPAPKPPIVEVRAEPVAAPPPAARVPVPEPAPKAAPAARPPVRGPFEPRQERSWTWVMALLGVGSVLAVGIAAYVERDAWYPAAGAPRQVFSPVSAAVGLNTVDEAGQLQIRWDANASEVRAATGARLKIADGGPAAAIPLDAQHLASGVFTYARRTERVDVSLVLDEPAGAALRQTTSFLGQKPPAPPADSGVKNQDAASLRSQLEAEIERNRKLQKQLDAARAQLRDQQLRRLNKQALPGEH